MLIIISNNDDDDDVMIVMTVVTYDVTGLIIGKYWTANLTANNVV